MVHQRRTDSVSQKPSGERFTTYKARHLETISTSVAVALASLLPGVSMLVLYHVNDMVLRIVLALISITMFSTLLKIFTAARTAEIYAATAGYVKRAKPLLAMTNKPDLPLSLSSLSGVTTSRKTEKTGQSPGRFDTHVLLKLFPESGPWIGVPYLHECELAI